MTQQWIDDGNRDYRHKLANSLLTNMSQEDAIDMCVENGWMDMLNDVISPSLRKH